MPVFVDTNVLVYARDSSDPQKHARALAWMEHLWRSASGRTGVQVLQEYYVTVTRKIRPGLAPTDARADVADLWSWRPVPVQERLLGVAWSIEDRFGLSFWDALIVAAAREARCETLLTENLQHDMDLDGIRVANPFRTDAGSFG